MLHCLVSPCHWPPLLCNQLCLPIQVLLGQFLVNPWSILGQSLSILCHQLCLPVQAYLIFVIFLHINCPFRMAEHEEIVGGDYIYHNILRSGQFLVKSWVDLLWNFKGKMCPVLFRCWAQNTRISSEVLSLWGITRCANYKIMNSEKKELETTSRATWTTWRGIMPGAEQLEEQGQRWPLWSWSDGHKSRVLSIFLLFWIISSGRIGESTS